MRRFYIKRDGQYLAYANGVVQTWTKERTDALWYRSSRRAQLAIDAHNIDNARIIVVYPQRRMH